VVALQANRKGALAVVAKMSSAVRKAPMRDASINASALVRQAIGNTLKLQLEPDPPNLRDLTALPPRGHGCQTARDWSRADSFYEDAAAMTPAPSWRD